MFRDALHPGTKSLMCVLHGHSFLPQHVCPSGHRPITMFGVSWPQGGWGSSCTPSQGQECTVKQWVWGVTAWLHLRWSDQAQVQLSQRRCDPKVPLLAPPARSESEHFPRPPYRGWNPSGSPRGSRGQLTKSSQQTTRRAGRDGRTEPRGRMEVTDASMAPEVTLPTSPGRLAMAWQDE